MPHPGKRWRHTILNTRCSWLPGDERGFRNRKHRIHSSGDYKNPPPPEEHSGLRKYHQERSGEPVTIPHALRSAVAKAFQEWLQKEGHGVLVVACGGKHLHALAELPDDMATIRAIIGRCKRAACEAVERELPGPIWAASGQFKRIKDQSHHRNAYRYIRDEQGPGAWVWTFREGDLGFRGVDWQ